LFINLFNIIILMETQNEIIKPLKCKCFKCECVWYSRVKQPIQCPRCKRVDYMVENKEVKNEKK